MGSHGLHYKPDNGRTTPKHVAWLNCCNNLQLLFILLYKDGLINTLFTHKQWDGNCPIYSSVACGAYG